jgi:hypothetical protein
MAKVLNGNLRLIITILVLLAAIIGSYAVFGRDVSEMKPEVKLNTEHRLRFEEKFDSLDKKVDAILEEVRKQ